jgi:hypothetical protein
MLNLIFGFMNRMDALLDLLSKIHQILVLVYNSKYHGSLVFEEDPQMNRQEVKDYLGISESTYKRMVKEGRLRPMKLPGGDKFYRGWRFMFSCVLAESLFWYWL